MFSSPQTHESVQVERVHMRTSALIIIIKLVLWDITDQYFDEDVTFITYTKIKGSQKFNFTATVLFQENSTNLNYSAKHLNEDE